MSPKRRTRGTRHPSDVSSNPALLDWVPRQELERAARLQEGPADLALNLSRVLQASEELPRELAQQVIADSSLRSRVGNTSRLTLDGIPAGLPPFDGAARLWLAHPTTRVWQPYEVGHDLLKLLEQVARGELAPRSLPPSLITLLLLADVLVPSRDAPAAQGYMADVRDARERLAADGYVVLPNVVSPLYVAALRRHYRGLERAGYLETDLSQVKERRDGVYCEFAALYIQDQLVRFLDRIVPVPIKPSYCWFFRYRPSAVLERHVDRPQCRWNVSFAVDASPDTGRSGAWPLCFEVAGRTHSVLLGSGDAVLYSGTDLPHWRDELPAGRTVSMCFFHYVDADFQGELG